MGVVGSTAQQTQFYSSMDVTFTLSGQTDGGLTFGATIDLDEIGDDCRGGTYDESRPGAIDINQNGVVDTAVFTCTVGDSIDATNRDGQGTEEQSIFVSGAFGTLTMGDTDGAYDFALDEAILGGTIADDLEHAGYNGNAGLDGTNDGQVATYQYALSGFEFAVSAELDDGRRINQGTNQTIYGVGARYTFSNISSAADVTVGAGYQGSGGVNIYGASINAQFSNGFQAILNYSRLDGNGVNSAADYSHYGIAVGYTMNALTIAANYGSYDFEAGASSDGYGLAVNYDLGGGAVLQAGYGNGTTRGAPRAEQYSFGLSMAF